MPIGIHSSQVPRSDMPLCHNKFSQGLVLPLLETPCSIAAPDSSIGHRCPPGFRSPLSSRSHSPAATAASYFATARAIYGCVSFSHSGCPLALSCALYSMV